MSDEALVWKEFAEKLIPSAYAAQGASSISVHQDRIRQLLQHGSFEKSRKIPPQGWSEATIEFFLQQLSLMDSNNFEGNVGVGEREGRCYSGIVSRRHFRLAHGIGRSGDVAAVQPKAAGSSLINKLANALALDAIRMSGIRSCSACCVIPVATGMALTLSMLYLKRHRPTGAKYVIWPRIDQKSCFKAILTAGLTPLRIEPVIDGDMLVTNLDAIQEMISKYGADSIVCIMSTTSCFAPRVPDSVEDIGRLCSTNDIPHLINNAYGLQASKITHIIEQGTNKPFDLAEVGKFVRSRTFSENFQSVATKLPSRVDVFVQSLDKNFMVPVGGAILASPSQAVVQAIAQSYPGRASATPSLDLLITLLSMGESGYSELLKKRKMVVEHLRQSLDECANAHGERLLQTPRNPISFAISLKQFDDGDPEGNDTVTKFGSMLFTRNCSGARAVSRHTVRSVEGHEFVGFGSHCDNYPVSYLNAAAAIGMEMNEVDVFMQRLNKCFKQAKKTSQKSDLCGVGVTKAD